MMRVIARTALLLSLLGPSIANGIPQPIGPHGEPPAPKSLKGFWVENDSSHVMVELYVVHPEAEEWGPNVLAGATLGPYERIKLARGDKRSDCLYSFEAVFENKKRYARENVDICASEGIVFRSEQ